MAPLDQLRDLGTRLSYRLLYRGDPSRVPWEQGKPHPPLVKYLESGRLSEGAKALDVGCGVGTQSLYMAERGLDVTGVDFLDQPLIRARERAQKRDLDCDFEQADMTKPARRGPYDFIFDRGCFHSLSPTGQRLYATNVLQWLGSHGWLQISCFVEGQGTLSWLPSPLPRVPVGTLLECFGTELELVEHRNVFPGVGPVPGMDVFLFTRPAKASIKS